MLSLFRGKNGDDLAQTLAQFQERANRSELSRDEAEVLRALDLSPEDLQKTAAARESLAKSERLRERAKDFSAAQVPAKVSVAVAGDGALRRLLERARVLYRVSFIPSGISGGGALMRLWLLP
jgi:hypothetical protein